MDERFYNINKKKKFGQWVEVQGTGLTAYDLGLFYVSKTVKELLETYYYAKKNISKRIPQEIYEIKDENYEVYFINRVFSVYIDVGLAKLIDKTKKTWSLYNLLKVVEKYNWPDEMQIKNEVGVFATDIKYIQKTRHERHAHVSQKNKPNLFYTNAGLEETYRNKVKKAMELVDNFVDGEIPYLIRYNESKEHDLREGINSK